MLGFLILEEHTEEGNNIGLKDGLSARVYNKIQFIQMSYGNKMFGAYEIYY
jgi:hypothetical protein|tara:strand:+ start:264 stop:416 length:153 start_codon:yes stop_codon:yes gene_type:complete